MARVLRGLRGRLGGGQPKEASCGPILVAAAVPAALGLWYFRQTRPVPLPMPKALQDAGASTHPALRKRKINTTGNGLVVTSPISHGECLARVPRAAVLSGKLAQDMLQAPMLPPDVALCALLAEARRAAEQGKDVLGLKEYLLALPGDFASLPLMFGEDAEEQLRGVALQPFVQLLLAKEEEDRQAALEQLGDRLEAAYSAQRWRWAHAAVLTRAGRGLPTTEEPGHLAIVPLLDFANTAEEPSASCRLCGDFIELVTSRDLKAGEEVTISYGEQSQEQQLFTFGFFLDGSPLEILTPLAMVAPPEDELRNVLLRLHFLERHEAANPALPDLPPFAVLRLDRAGWLDLSELYVTSNLLAMPESDLRDIAEHVKQTHTLPERVRVPSLTALRHLVAVLAQWHEELSAPAPKAKEPRFAATRAYRRKCRELVAQALQRVRKELASVIDGGWPEGLVN